MSDTSDKPAGLPSDLQVLLETLTAELRSSLGPNLVGVYLYGSLTLDSFNPASSDVDGIVVVSNDLSDREFDALHDWIAESSPVNPWVNRLDLLILPLNAIMEPGPALCRLNEGVLTRCSSDGNPVIWLNIADCGITLTGPAPAQFIPPISAGAISACLQREVEYLAEGIAMRRQLPGSFDPDYHVYAVLTLCRIVYTFHLGRVVSKPDAASWCIANLPREWHGIIVQALADTLESPYATLPGAISTLEGYLVYVRELLMSKN